jgi:hypothetical protein
VGFSVYECDVDKALKIGLFREAFYSNIVRVRHRQLRRAVRREVIRGNGDGKPGPAVTAPTRQRSRGGGRKAFRAGGGKPSSETSSSIEPDSGVEYGNGVGTGVGARASDAMADVDNGMKGSGGRGGGQMLRANPSSGVRGVGTENGREDDEDEDAGDDIPDEEVEAVEHQHEHLSMIIAAHQKALAAKVMKQVTEADEAEDNDDDGDKKEVEHVEDSIGVAGDMFVDAFEGDLKVLQQSDETVHLLSTELSGKAEEIAINAREEKPDHEHEIRMAALEKLRLNRQLQKQRLLALVENKTISYRAKSARMLEVIGTNICNVWLRCRHLALLVIYFRFKVGNAHKTKHFGNYVVDLVVSMYVRLTDLQNFDTVMKLLNARETAAVYCRLGLLNIFNPMKPDGAIELELSRREEKVVAKMIVYLSAVEPGENLSYQTFQWKRTMDLTPGWQVTQGWLTEKDMPIHGIVCLSYYSGDNVGNLGCVAIPLVRKALTQLVLIDENEVYDESDPCMVDRDGQYIAQVFVNSALKHYQVSKNNAAVWSEYLAVLPSKSWLSQAIDATTTGGPPAPAVAGKK